MPQFFKEWLESLTPDRADDMWDYADSSPIAEEVIKVVAPLSPKYKQ